MFFRFTLFSSRATIYIDTFIEIVSRGEFRNGYNVGKNITKSILTTPPGTLRIVLPDDFDEWADDETDEDDPDNY